MRCPDCAKFTGLEFDTDPDINNEEFNDEDGTYDITVRIVRTCSDCGQEMKEAEIEFSEAIDGWEDIRKEHTGEGHDIEMSVEASNDEYGEGAGRYMKSFFGAEVEVSIKCSCSDETLYDATHKDHVQASAMDEMV